MVAIVSVVVLFAIFSSSTRSFVLPVRNVQLVARKTRDVSRRAVEPMGASKTYSARDVALDILLAVSKAGSGGAHTAFSSHPQLNQLSQRDRSFAKVLVATTERRQVQLDTLLGSYMGSYPPKFGAATNCVQNALRLGAVQLLFLSTPPHAAVSSTVDLIRRRLTRNADTSKMRSHTAAAAKVDRCVQLINAVLRTVAARGPADLAATSLLDNIHHQQRRAWEQSWGAEAAGRIGPAMLRTEPTLDLTLRGPPPPKACDSTAATEDGVWRQRWAQALGANVLPSGSLRCRESDHPPRAPCSASDLQFLALL